MCLFSCWILGLLIHSGPKFFPHLCPLQILSPSIRGLSLHLLMAELPSQARRSGHIDSFCGSPINWQHVTLLRWAIYFVFCFLLYRTGEGMRIFLRFFAAEESMIVRAWPKFTLLISGRVWLKPRLSPTLLLLFARRFFLLF